VSLEKKIKLKRIRKKLRVKSRVKSNLSAPRVSVFRSLNQIYGQLIDDNKGVTLSSFSSLELKDKGSKKDIARKVGQELAKKAIEQGIKSARFDRGRFLYHGRVKAFAEGLRDSGLEV
jgi:large subunit ribosomal protein L18